MAEAAKEKKGFIHPRGVLVVGVTGEDVGRIQNLFDGEATIEVRPEDGSVIVRKAGVSKLDVAEAIEAATDIVVDGLDDLRVKKIPTKIHGKRVELIRTRDSNRHPKPID